MAEYVKKNGKVWNDGIAKRRLSDGREVYDTVHTVGTRKVFKRGFPTLAEARGHLARVRTAKTDGVYQRPSRETVAEFLDYWLDEVVDKSVKLRPRTREGYRSIVETHLKPRFGRRLLADLRAEEVEGFYRDLASRRSENTVRHVAACLSKAMRYAERHRGIRNPCPLAASELPQVEKRPPTVWSATNLAMFQSVADERLAVAVRLAVASGLRRGELCGLRWSDIDLDAGTLHVRQTRITSGSEVRFGEPKTEASRAPVTIDSATVNLLRAWKLRQEPSETDLVLTEADGSPTHPNTLSRRFKRTCKAAEVPVIRFHDLRHTSGTLALEAHVDIAVVSKRLRHSTISTTADIYAHVTEKLDRESAEVLGAALG